MISDNSEKNMEIIHAAQAAFSEYGYKKITMDDIAGKLDMCRSALYYYYKNKEDIFRDVMAFELDQYNFKILREISAVETPKEKLLTLAVTYSRHRRNFISTYKLTTEDIFETTKLFRDFRQGIFELHDSIIMDILKSDPALSGVHDPKRAAHILTLAMRGIVFNTPADKQKLLEDELICLCNIWYCGLRHQNDVKNITGIRKS